MTSPLTFHVPGPPQNWQRVNVVKGRKLTDAKSRAYRRHVQACARVALAHRCWPLLERYSLEIEVSYPDKRRRDIDNAAKAIMDALNGITWADDSQVDDLSIRRMRPGNPGITIHVTTVNL